MTLENHFDYTFGMIQHHHWSLSEVENMIPWERDIYLEKLNTFIKEENERNKESQRRSSQNG
tara:strand:- start:198 stop:383 length:186 start_codon:yes stop_codon:yes gene_type:complete